MKNKSNRKDLNLKTLELFQICAEKGSLNAVAVDTGLSVSTVSHHLRSLEDYLGINLFDHTRRPMVLTQKGQLFLHNISDALHTIRKAKAEASLGDLDEASYLRLGIIEDFDSDIIPKLATYLSANLRQCEFMYHTDTSYNIIEMLRDRKLDIGIISNPPDQLAKLTERPLIKDPFIIALPSDPEQTISDLLSTMTSLPFLRFPKNMIIGRQIDSHLSRLGLNFPSKFECGNSQTLLAMVADGAGWTITTPLLLSRAKRFQSKLNIHQFPMKAFSRDLSIISSPDCSRLILDLVDKKMRKLITKYIIEATNEKNPWLAKSFSLIK